MLRKHAFAALLAVMQSLAHAGGVGGSIVFDPANFTKNAITAAETARQTAEQVRANVTHLKQLEQLVAARQPLTATEMALTGNATSAPEIDRRIEENGALAKALDTLSADIDASRTRYNLRFNAAQAQGLTLAAYYERVKARAAQGEKQALAEIESDKKRLEKISGTYTQITSWSGTINGIDSQVAGLSVLSSQMNLMVAQNAELMGFMVRESTARRRQRIEAEQEVQRVADEDVQTEAASTDIYRKSKQDLMSALKNRSAATATKLPGSAGSAGSSR